MAVLSNDVVVHITLLSRLIYNETRVFQEIKSNIEYLLKRLGVSEVHSPETI